MGRNMIDILPDTMVTLRRHRFHELESFNGLYRVDNLATSKPEFRRGPQSRPGHSQTVYRGKGALDGVQIIGRPSLLGHGMK